VIFKESAAMKIAHYTDTQPTEELPGVLKREVITAGDGAPNFCMRVFDVEPGSSTPNHTHDWEHEVFVLDGEGVVEGAGGKTLIGPGSVVFVAPNEQHCFINTGGDILRFVCLIPLQK
jgi:quercetin dioxygenase-like cupin family protein